MDSDQWISRLAAAKRRYSLQHHQSSQLDRLGMDDFEVEEGIRPDFPCPYCHEDHDVTSLCTHLEDEHSLESKVALCVPQLPKIWRTFLASQLQALKLLLLPSDSSIGSSRDDELWNDKRRRRLRRVAISNSQALSLLGRDLREAHLQVILGSGGYQSSNTAASNAVTDSLLSSLVLNFQTSEEPLKSTISAAETFISKKRTPLWTLKSSFDLSLSREEREQKRKQATARVMFVQDLFLSTLFED